MKFGAEGNKSTVQDGVALTETQVLLLTLWGEGRGEPVEGRIAIGSVIRNRVLWGKWGDSYTNVCLAPWQFSCWRVEGGKSNYEALGAMARALSEGREITDSIARECGWIAHGIIGAWLRDNVAGATHYMTRQLFESSKRPRWAAGKTPVASVGDHVFFKGIA